MGPDRLELLVAQTSVTGISHVFVHPDQTRVDVHFHLPPPTLVPPWTVAVPIDAVTIESISDRSERPLVPIEAVAWTTVDGQTVLRIDTRGPGDFSNYRVRVASDRLDRRFAEVEFSFKVDCPTDLDCAPPDPACPPEPSVDYAVDYRARDFWSFRQALLDFASQRYPQWEDRLEADVGVMLVEVMASIGDEMAYYQDRVARQATLRDATERHSVRQHARLVDYEIDDGEAAVAWLDVTVAEGAAVQIAAGTDVWAGGEADEEVVMFEVGHGLGDGLSAPPVSFSARGDWNSLAPHVWDEDEVCLRWGSTDLWVAGHHRDSLFPVGSASRRPLILSTNPTDPDQPSRVHLVWVAADDVEEDRDDLLATDVTRLVWDARWATPFDLDLAVMEVRANLVPASAGRTMSRHFTIGRGAATEVAPAAVEREGPGRRVSVYRQSLDGSAAAGVSWHREGDTLVPEVRLFEHDGTDRGEPWAWRRSLLGVASSAPEDRHFTLEDGTWGPVLEFDRPTETIVHEDYRSGTGFTVRFGDGEFGRVPAGDTRFELIWRLGNGSRTDVAADTIVHSALLVPADPAFDGDVVAVTNPLAASGGRDPQSLDQVRRQAPEAFRAVTHRAVRPEDHAEAVERLDGVQRAGAELRWTGSWLSVFATPDPVGSLTLAEPLRIDVQDQLDRVRQAGRPAHVRRPRFAFLDVEVTICVAPNAFQGEVREQVLRVLFGEGHPWSAPGFFSPDHFTFGTPLERSRLEAAIHTVAGVRAIEGLRIRRPGRFAMRTFREARYTPAASESIAIANDPRYPEQGSLRIVTTGGA